MRGILQTSEPEHACSPIKPLPIPANPDNDMAKRILIVPRYTMEKNCSFEYKVRTAQAAGYVSLIVHNVNSDQLIPMYAANSTGIDIPSVFVSEESGKNHSVLWDRKCSWKWSKGLLLHRSSI